MSRCVGDGGWRETMSQDRHDRAAASDMSRPRGRPPMSRGGPYGGGGWGPRSSRGRRQQCKSAVLALLSTVCCVSSSDNDDILWADHSVLFEHTRQTARKFTSPE